MNVPLSRISCALVKICQIPHVISQTTSGFFFKLCIILQCYEIQFLCTFLAQTLYTLVKSSPLKSKCLRLSSSRFKIRQIRYVNLKQQVSSSSDFLSFFSVVTYNSSVSCSSCILYFGQKDPMKIPILTLSSVLMKTCQIPHVIFQTASQFFFKFCVTLQCHEI